MKVEFWGTRGSVAAPGLDTARYGGNTPCVSVRLQDESLLILDAGTGIRKLGHALMHEQPVTAHLFLSHCHWDHIQGFPFFAPAYAPGTRLRVYGYPSARQKVRKTMSDQMEGAYFPVDFGTLKASIEFIDVWSDTREIGTARVSMVELNHPGGGVGFRIQEGPTSFVYLTDNELAAGNEERFIQFCEGASLLAHDSHFTPAELGTHRGWGHSSYEEVLELARRAHVRNVALFHHDPERTDAELDAIGAACRAELERRGDRFQCIVAAEGMTVEL